MMRGTYNLNKFRWAGPFTPTYGGGSAHPHARGIRRRLTAVRRSKSPPWIPSRPNWSHGQGYAPLSRTRTVGDTGIFMHPPQRPQLINVVWPELCLRAIVSENDDVWVPQDSQSSSNHTMERRWEGLFIFTSENGCELQLLRSLPCPLSRAVLHNSRRSSKTEGRRYTSCHPIFQTTQAVPIFQECGTRIIFLKVWRKNISRTDERSFLRVQLHVRGRREKVQIAVSCILGECRFVRRQGVRIVEQRREKEIQEILLANIATAPAVAAILR